MLLFMENLSSTQTQKWQEGGKKYRQASNMVKDTEDAKEGETENSVPERCLE